MRVVGRRTAKNRVMSADEAPQRSAVAANIVMMTAVIEADVTDTAVGSADTDTRGVTIAHLLGEAQKAEITVSSTSAERKL